MVATTGDKRKIIHIRYPCHVCHENCKTAASVINHATLIHGQKLPSRRIGIKRPKSSLYRYEMNIEEEWDELHYGCPSCWFHCESFETCQAHIEENHCDKKQSKEVAENGDKKSVKFVDEEENRKEPDLNKASDIAQQIIDLGGMLKGMLKL